MEAKQEVQSSHSAETAEIEQQLSGISMEVKDDLQAPKNDLHRESKQILANLDKLEQQLPIVNQLLIDDVDANAKHHILYAQSYCFLCRLLKMPPGVMIGKTKHVLRLTKNLYQFGELLRKNNTNSKTMTTKVGELVSLILHISPQCYWDILTDREKESTLGQCVKSILMDEARQNANSSA